MNLRRRLNYLLPAYRRAEERDMQEELNALAEMAEPGELGNLTRVAEEGARHGTGPGWSNCTAMRSTRSGPCGAIPLSRPRPSSRWRWVLARIRPSSAWWMR